MRLWFRNSRPAETGLSGRHGPIYTTVKIRLICHGLFGKSGLTSDFELLMGVAYYWCRLQRTLGTSECVFHADHPAGPVVWLDASRESPWAICIKLPMPLQHPQLLEGDLTRGPVGKETVLRPAMPIYAEPLHLVHVRP